MFKYIFKTVKTQVTYDNCFAKLISTALEISSRNVLMDNLIISKCQLYCWINCTTMMDGWLGLRKRAEIAKPPAAYTV